MGYINTDNQVFTFLWSLVLGVAMCLAYDIVRAFHKVSVKGFFEVMLSDLLFWGLWSLITFSFLILRCKGEVRAYVLFGQAIGFIIARISVSKLFYRFFTFVLRASVRMFAFFGSNVRKTMECLEKNIKKILKLIKKGLQHKVKLLYNQLKVHKKNNSELQENESGNT